MVPRTLLLAVLALAPAAAHAQRAEAGTQWVSTASEAYLISAASTLGAVGLGAALYRVSPELDPESDRFGPRHAAVTLIALGVLVGPAMGNVALGAETDAQRGMAIKGVGISAGGAIALSSTLVVLGCLGGSACGGAVTGVLVAGAVVAGTGIVAGTVYDLATIPRNATRGRPAVAVGPGGAGLSLTVAF